MSSARAGPLAAQSAAPATTPASSAAVRREFRALASFAALSLSFGLIFFFSEAVRFVILNPGGQGSTVLADDPTRAPMQLLIFAITAALLVAKWRKSIAAVKAAWPFWAVSLIAVLSVGWSADRALSMRYAAWLTATALLGMHFDLRFEVKQQLRILGVALGTVLIVSILFVAFVPTLGIETGIHAGAWRGAFVHKNSLGRAMALTALVFALLLPTARRSAAFTLTALAVALLLGWNSRSATAPILFVLLAGILPVRALLRSKALSTTRVVIVSIAIATLVGWFALENLDVILAALGRDSSLSGRPLLWAVLIPEILDQPVVGYGLAAFWKGSSGLAADVEGIVGWNPGQAHNGFIDAALDLGILGLAVLVAGLGILSLRAASVARRNSASVYSLWPLGYVAFFVMSNMTESSILRANTIYWFLLSAVATRVFYSDQRGQE